MTPRLTPPYWAATLFCLTNFAVCHDVSAQDVKTTEVYRRIKTSIDSVPAIDTHDHLRSFNAIPGRVETPEGRGMTLRSLWGNSYVTRTTRITRWPADQQFDTWWKDARDDFDDVRACSFYRYMLPAFRDLYGVDFDTITHDQARDLNGRIFANYRDDKWLIDVVTKRANIELMFIDPHWNRLQFAQEYKFSVPVLNVTMLMSASHPDRIAAKRDSPFAWAARKNLKCETFDEFLSVIDAIFTEAVASDAACLKSTQAYQRSLRYQKVTKEQAASVFGKTPDEATDEQQRQFEDFMFWHVCHLSAKYELPFQVHTGDARIQGSNPILLVDVIEANPQTKFILFHGGYPWVGETGAIAMKHRNVWIDSCWLPTLSYTMAKRAYQEWLEAAPSNRIMWRADISDAEGIYGATEFTRQCLAEALAEKVARDELREEHANRIGRQIMRDNALALFPKLRRRLWRTAAARSSRVAGIVAKWVRGDKEANYRRVEPMIRKAAKNGAQIVCTTECFLDGYAIADKSIPLKEYRALGEPIPDGIYFRKLQSLAKELKIQLIAGMLEADGEKRFNTAVVISPAGELIGKYRKQHLGHELERNTPGDVSSVFTTSHGKVGVMICADRRFPEIVNGFIDNGADLLICPSGGMFGSATNDPIVQARSRETKRHIIFVHPAEFLVTAPDGSIAARTILGDRLFVSKDKVGTEADSNRVFYFDLPGE
jgi:predicted amidohydrolase/predicted TIM-barrel fold metal-dependent hydrolase